MRDAPSARPHDFVREICVAVCVEVRGFEAHKKAGGRLAMSSAGLSRSSQALPCSLPKLPARSIR